MKILYKPLLIFLTIFYLVNIQTKCSEFYFPQDILFNIFSHLRHRDLDRLKLVNKNFYTVAQSDLVRELTIFNNNTKEFFSVPSGYATFYGFTGNSVNCVTHFKNILLVGHEEGLSISKDKGKTFTNINMTNGLISNQVKTIFVDNNGYIFVGTQKGLSIFKFERDDIIHVENPLDCKVIKVCACRKGNTFVLSKNHIYVFKCNKNEIKLLNDDYILNKSMKKNPLGYFDIHIDKRNFLYFSTENIVYIYKYQEENDFTFIKSIYVNNENSEGIFVNSIFSDQKNSIYLSTSHGLFIFNYQNEDFELERTITTNDCLPSNFINSSFIDSNKRIYVNTECGLSTALLKDLKFKTFTQKDGLGSNDILNVSIDQDGTIFVASSGGAYGIGGGLSIISKDMNIITNRSQEHPTSGHGNNKRLTIDKFNNIYITSNEGLFVSEDMGKSFTNLTTDTHKLLSNELKDVFTDNDGTIYLASKEGISIVLVNDIINLPFIDKINPETVRSIFVHKDKIFVGTDIGLVVVDNTRNKNYKISTITTSNGLGSNDIRDVWVNSSGTIFVATAKGLSISQDQNKFLFKNHTTENGLCHDIVHRVFDENRKITFVSTHQGLSILTKNSDFKFINLKTSHGLFKNKVKTVAIDQKGYLYTLHNHGVSKSTESIDIIEDFNQLKFISYSEQHGIDEYLCDFAIDKDGIVIIATHVGSKLGITSHMTKLLSKKWENGILNNECQFKY